MLAYARRCCMLFLIAFFVVLKMLFSKIGVSKICVFKNKCGLIKMGVLFNENSVFFIKITRINNKKRRPTARDGRRTGGRSVGFFVVYFCVSDEKTH